MDRQRVVDMIAAPEGGEFWVRALRVNGWGGEIALECSYVLAVDEAIMFHIKLTDCREIQWRVYAHLLPPDDKTLPLVHLVNLRLGTDNHRKPFQVLTDAFALTVSYGSLTLEKAANAP